MNIFDQRLFVRGIAVAAVALSVTVQAASLAVAGDGSWTGSFQGASGHATRGTVTVTQNGDALTLKLGGNFSLDGAPDPWIGFGLDGTFIGSTLVSELRSNNGAQTYNVPASVDINAVNEVYIWCDKFSVPLGVAHIR